MSSELVDCSRNASFVENDSLTWEHMLNPAINQYKQENLSRAAGQVLDLINLCKRSDVDATEDGPVNFEMVLARLMEYARMGEREYLSNSRDETSRRFRHNVLVYLYVLGRVFSSKVRITEQLKLYAAVEQLCIPELENNPLAPSIKTSAAKRLATINLGERDASVYVSVHCVFNYLVKVDGMLRQASSAAFSEDRKPDYARCLKSLISIYELRQEALQGLLPEYHFLLDITESEIHLMRYACERYAYVAVDYYEAMDDKEIPEFKFVWTQVLLRCLRILQTQLSDEFSTVLNSCAGRWKFVKTGEGNYLLGELSIQKNMCLPWLVRRLHSINRSDKDDEPIE